MAIFKCKMCGGTLEFNPGDTVAVCDSCGTKQTLPRLDDDKKANLYDRANHFRRNNEYDKAMSIYEQILAEDNTDAEAYWSLVLCRYGIEYVEDPATGKRIPTVNRAQFTSVFDDDNYKSALRCADAAQKEIYQAEAKAINEIQKGILAISQKEEPFDVFICYKETDSRGARTPDSVLANDLYHQLTLEGFKVFFSRITLEDKLGSAYEPYIFAALNSARVMVVLGTRPEYFNAVWVKNEWSRYLALIKNGAKKMLIPAYKDMDPYDLPEEFSHLQAQDMGKLGFMQDLIRGIKKIVASDEQKTAAKPAAPAAAGSTGAAPLLERAFLFLEDGKWSDADTYCEKVLDIDPKNAQAYLGKLMAELQVSKRGQLSDCAQPFDKNENYLKILRFGDEALNTELRGYIDKRNKNAIYNEACSVMKSAAAQMAFLKGAELFKSISGFRDADALAAQCLEKAESCRKDAVYTTAISRMAVGNTASYKQAIAIFKTIPGWRDADSQIYACQKRIEEIKAKEEAARLEALRKAEEKRIAAAKRAKRLKKFAAIATPVLCVCIAFVIVLNMVIIPQQKYNKAMNLLESGDYDSAYSLLEEINKDDDIKVSKYNRAMKLLESEDYDSAYALLKEIDDNETIASSKRSRAMKLLDSGDFDSAYTLLKEIDDNETIASSKRSRAMKLLDSGDFDYAYTLLRAIGDNETIFASKYDRAIKCIDSGDYESAYILLKDISYKDSKEKCADIKTKCKQILAVGDKFTFGTYEQDNDTSNGAEDIEWLVLAKENNKILVISDKVLDFQPYNEKPYYETRKAITWEQCSLRKWLNDSFLNEAFSEEERALIQSTTVSVDKIPNYHYTDPGNATTDKVFLLSYNDAEKHFSDHHARKCTFTAYAKAQRAAAGKGGVDAWWLRSLTGPYYAAVSDAPSGALAYYIYDTSDGGGVRPALWIDLDSMKNE